MGLTDLQIKKLVPRSIRFEVLDSKGLYIRVTPNGTKSWIFRYQFNGMPRRMTLGNYPGITLADARTRHGEALQDIQRGIDPGAKAKEEKSKLKAAPTMRELVDELFETELQHKRSGLETKRLLEKDVVSTWGRRRVADIKRRDIVLLLDGIVKRKAPITRNRVHSALTRLFNFAAERGVIEDSPCTRIRKPAEGHKSRVLTDDELKALWKGLDLENEAIDVFWTTKLALKFQLLTGQRSGEICGMTWNELDLEKDIWTIPAARMKNRQAHVLPLTAIMKSIIEQARGFFGGNSPFVFPSPNYKDVSITAHSLSRGILRHRKELGMNGDPFTPHDIRRTVRTRLAELSVDEFIAERVLGHKLQGMLAVYNQHDYLPEKRKALEAWERRLKKIIGIEIEKGKVVSIMGGRHHG